MVKVFVPVNADKTWDECTDLEEINPRAGMREQRAKIRLRTKLNGKKNV